MLVVLSMTLMRARILRSLSRFAAILFLVSFDSSPWSAVARAAEPATVDQRKNVVLIAGKKSHGPEGNGIHDYGRSVRLLKRLLERSNVAERIRVETSFDGWPGDPALIENADTIMIISDGRDGDKYEEALHLVSPERVAAVERQMARGCGFVVFHFSTFAPDRYGEAMLRWHGAYFDWENDGKREWYSAIKTIEAEVKLVTSEHPVLRGVKPFRLREEFYFNMRFPERDSGLIKLLEVPALSGRAESGNVVAWARQREDGGRGFGTSCGHFFDNWKNDDFRKLLLNAIVWSARIEVPEQGVRSSFDSSYSECEETTANEGE
jgi:type 1 glutamine amidotransferase